MLMKLKMGTLNTEDFIDTILESPSVKYLNDALKNANNTIIKLNLYIL